MPVRWTDTLLEKPERAALCDLLEELGPDAPTLCDGWTTQDIAIHLYVCEARPDAWLAVPMGNRSPTLRRHFDGIIDRQRAKGWPALVAQIRQGPKHGPNAHQQIRERMMLREYLIHHEDVRRANGLPVRSDIPELQDA